jgi:hypothetical protein
MIVKTVLEAIEDYLKATNAYGVFLSSSEGDEAEVAKAVPLLSEEGVRKLVMHNELFVPFATKAEARKFFDSVVGDDGPTKSNPYDGPAKVYALMGGPYGWLTENT